MLHIRCVRVYDDTMTTTKGNTMAREFIIGETYGCRSACDWDTMFTWQVVARTAKFITVRERGERDRRVKVYVIDGVERAVMGNYSMAPVIYADRIAA